jgi:hypothetical protein
VENSRLYFKLRPSRVPLAADPECTIHRAFGLPKVAISPEVVDVLSKTRVNPTGELPAPIPIMETLSALDKIHNFAPTATDRSEHDKQIGQMKGQFLLDRGGVVRWANVECATEGLPGIGKFPSADIILSAARSVV